MRGCGLGLGRWGGIWGSVDGEQKEYGGGVGRFGRRTRLKREVLEGTEVMEVLFVFWIRYWDIDDFSFFYFGDCWNFFVKICEIVVWRGGRKISVIYWFTCYINVNYIFYSLRAGELRFAICMAYCWMCVYGLTNGFEGISLRSVYFPQYSCVLRFFIIFIRFGRGIWINWSSALVLWNEENKLIWPVIS